MGVQSERAAEVMADIYRPLFLEAIADPSNEAHAEMIEWYGSDFDVEDAGIDRILDKYEYLAKKWAPRPRKTTAKSRSS